MRLFGLIGYPLSHSFSDKYFAEKFEKENIIDCGYKLFPLNDIREINDLIQNNHELEGLNVTIPYKKQVIPFLHELQIPEGLEACNCIKISEGKLIGYNTDWIAFKESIAIALEPQHAAALILGNGGAADAVKYALTNLGLDVKIVSRVNHEGSDYVYEELDEAIIYEHKVIVNTTPLGLFPKTEEYPPIPYEHINSDHLLFDLIYNPAKTLFLQKGEEQGAKTLNGSEMLVLQAEESWRIWNGY